MSSTTKTLWKILPLWISKLWPTNSGTTVQRRDHVLTGVRSLASFCFRLFLRHELDHDAGRAPELPAAPRLELDAVDRDARRDVPERHGVPGLDLVLETRDHLVADLEVLGRQDVAASPVDVVHERDPAR